jgi:hypothetical protein
MDEREILRGARRTVALAMAAMIGTTLLALLLLAWRVSAVRL